MTTRREKSKPQKPQINKQLEAVNTDQKQEQSIIMTLTSFFAIVGLIGLVAFIGTAIYFHHQDVMLKENI